MKRNIFVFLLLILLMSSQWISQSLAVTLKSDPQYIVMDFADIILLDWGVPQDKWEKEIKPKIVSQIRELKNALPKGTANRKLAWATLQEYMNHPMDTPSENSYYAIKIRRILEIAEEEDLPIFMPLNGTQWWDELPELYNWWDPDGTKTDPAFFKRQRTPDFKERFIKGYDPENIWNVDWQDPKTPMQLNYRDWGGGGFRLAPPPNLLPTGHQPKYTYHHILKSRLDILLTELVKKLDEWEKKGKSDLFAGLVIGAEVSLNASVKPANEFEPYGFRAMQDLLCSPQDPKCLATKKLTTAEKYAAQAEIIRRYNTDIAQFIVNHGVPKQRVYTHVWGEAQPSEKKFGNYIPGAFNLYSRPGLSFYDYGKDPFSLAGWYSLLKKNGWPTWGAAEYSPTKETDIWRKGLSYVFENDLDQGKIIIMYNWAEHKDTPAMPALAELLKREIKPVDCSLPEIIPTTANHAHNPTDFSWNYLEGDLEKNIDSVTLTITNGYFPASPGAALKTITIAKNDHSFKNNLSAGLYNWHLETRGCNGEKKQYSAPHIFSVDVPAPKDTAAWWVKIIRRIIQ